MDMTALQHRAGDVGLVGIARPQPLDRGILAAKGAQELEGELSPVKRLKRRIGNGFFDLDGVHTATLGMAPAVAKGSAINTSLRSGPAVAIQ